MRNIFFFFVKYSASYLCRVEKHTAKDKTAKDMRNKRSTVLELS